MSMNFSRSKAFASFGNEMPRPAANLEQISQLSQTRRRVQGRKRIKITRDNKTTEKRMVPAPPADLPWKTISTTLPKLKNTSCAAAEEVCCYPRSTGH